MWHFLRPWPRTHRGGELWHPLPFYASIYNSLRRNRPAAHRLHSHQRRRQLALSSINSIHFHHNHHVLLLVLFTCAIIYIYMYTYNYSLAVLGLCYVILKYLKENVYKLRFHICIDNRVKLKKQIYSTRVIFLYFKYILIG